MTSTLYLAVSPSLMQHKRGGTKGESSEAPGGACAVWNMPMHATLPEPDVAVKQQQKDIVASHTCWTVRSDGAKAIVCHPVYSSPCVLKHGK